MFSSTRSRMRAHTHRQRSPINNTMFHLTRDCFSCHLIGGGKDSCHDVGYISGIKRFLKSAVTPACLTWRASLISIRHLPKVSTLSCQIQLTVYSVEAFFAYSSHLFMVYWAGHFPCLLEQLLRWWPPPPPPFLLNRGWRTTCVLLPVKFLFAGEACWWPHVQPLPGPYE